MTIREFVEDLYNNSQVQPETIDLSTAEMDLNNFRADGWTLPEDITPESYMDAWNKLVEGSLTADAETKEISLDNAATFLTAEEAMPEIIARNLWDIIVYRMDDDTREAVHADLAPCTNLEFLKEYLRRAPHNLIIG